MKTPYTTFKWEFTYHLSAESSLDIFLQIGAMSVQDAREKVNKLAEYISRDYVLEFVNNTTPKEITIIDNPGELYTSYLVFNTSLIS